MAGTLFSNFGILLTEGQRKYDLNADEYHKGILASLGGGIPVRIVGSEGEETTEDYVVPVAGRTTKVLVEITRPADVTAYAAKDVIGPAVTGVFTFTNVAIEAGSGGYIVKARLLTNNVTFLAACRLHLYTTAPTAIADNAQFPLLYANAAIRIGFIDFPALTTEGTGSDATMAICTPGSSAPGNIPLAFTCDPASRSIFGILEVLAAATPISAQKFTVELHVEQN